MFEGAPDGYPKNYDELLVALNRIVQQAPEFGPLGPPVYMIINQAMNTQGGFTAFIAEKLNYHFKKMFETWAFFLDSADSRYVLNNQPTGWLSTSALDALVKDFALPGQPPPKFEQVFVCKPNEQYYGFKSFDDFFNRRFVPGNPYRPVQFSDKPNVINVACEAVCYNYNQDVKPSAEFWIKGEPYSLRHILNNDPDYLSQFEGSNPGATVYQGFLQTTGYHRWHSPVTGVIQKVVQVPGTYFAQSPAVLGEKNNPFLRSLAFITSITTRALIFIKSDNPSIGLMCFIAIGMTEISTCEVTVKPGQSINRGDELGLFHFGGSSNVLVFRPETTPKLKFFTEPIERGDNVAINSALAEITS